MKIDAHMHFWQLKKGYYNWIKPQLKEIYSDFLPGDYFTEIRRTAIEQCIVIEASAQLSETSFLLNLYENHSIIAGVVGYINLQDANFKNDFQAFKKRKGLIGLRFRKGWRKLDRTNNPLVRKNLSYLEENQVPIVLTVELNQYFEVCDLMEEFPDLKIMIDPAGNLENLSSEVFLDEWKFNLNKISELSSVMSIVKPFDLMKITDNDTVINKFWNKENYITFVRETIEGLGSNRVAFGSNWPVSLVIGDYMEIVNLFKQSVSNLRVEEVEKIYGENIKNFYSIRAFRE